VKSHSPAVFKRLYDGATVLRSKDLEQRGLTRAQIRQASGDGVLERVAHGLYALAGVEPTEHHSLVQVARRVPNAAICLLSALRFHDLTTQNPHEVWIAINPKDRKPVSGSPPLRVVRYGPQNFDLGLVEHQVEGTRIRVYSVARTIVDLFRYRNKIGLEVALEALKEGWRSRRYSLAEINRIAGLCRMQRVMKPYLESLVA
jgi:predicted transcriptional regulator of viral defense system